MGAGSDSKRDFRQVEVHRLGVAAGQDQPRGLALLRADRPEDIGRLRTLIMGCRRPRPAFRPAPGDLVLLSDPRLVLEPDLYRCTAREARSDLVQFGSEAPFLNASIAAGS